VGGLLDDVDVAAHFGERSPPGPWVSYEVMRVRARLIAHVDYLARRGTPATLQDLAQHELFAWECPDEDPRAWPLLSGGTLRVEPVLVASDIHFVRQCALAGLGIALVPDAMVPDPGTAPGAVVSVLDDQVGRDLAVRIVVPSVLTEVPRVKALLNHVRAFTGQL